MTVVIVAGNLYFAQRRALEAGYAHPVERHVHLVTPHVGWNLNGVTVTKILPGEASEQVPLEALQRIRSHCGPAGWPGPMHEPTWPQPEEQPE